MRVRDRVNEAINPARKSLLFPGRKKKKEEKEEKKKEKEMHETSKPDIRSVLESDSTRKDGHRGLARTL